jgi:hypothetical protein
VSPVIDVQRRYRELGRLRLGRKRRTDTGQLVPQRLATWRLTSPDRRLLNAAADVWGGEVGEWTDAPTEGDQWELITEANELQVYVPPQDLDAGQWFELWTRGGVQRRCNGSVELISGQACLCDPADRACTLTTHLAVVLPQLPDVGVWRVRTSSWNAAAELPSSLALLQRIHEAGALPIALLGIEARTKVREGKTTHFTVPVLRYPDTIAAAEAAGIPVLSGRRRTGPELPPERPALPDEAAFATDDEPWGRTPEPVSADPEADMTIEDAADASPYGGTGGEPVEASAGAGGETTAAALGKGATPAPAATSASPPGTDPAEAIAGTTEPYTDAPEPPAHDTTPDASGPQKAGESPVSDRTPDWPRLEADLLALGAEVMRAIKRACIERRWGWPPTASWQPDRLAFLEDAVAAAKDEAAS